MNKKPLVVLLIGICMVQITSGQNARKKSENLLTITGKVFNQEGKRVEGATFFIDNLKTNFISKSDGSYKIKVSNSSLKLKVVSPQSGFSETLIDGRTTINFTLEGIALLPYDDQKETETANSINKGYGSADQNNITTRINQIDGKNKKYISFTDIFQMINGTVSGVQVSGKNITIRGRNSFSLSSDPMFVVDDVVVSSIEGIEPSRVSSIELLKDGSAAIYGSRAANGVIIIRLKGTEGNK